ncbi:MAG: saccharopine dehydrogenase, partial [Cyanobacteria bacterium J06607_10]
GQDAGYVATFDHEDTAFCAGCGTGAIAQLILSNRLQKPGVWPVEQALTTELFLETLHQRKLSVKKR